MWNKKGCIFNLEPAEWRTTHAQVPTPLLFDDFIRVYYACRTDKNKSFPAFFDLCRKDLKTILHVHEQPIMSPGEVGMFDDCGVMPSCAIRDGDDVWLYYIGWNERVNGARYQNEIGLSISDDGEVFNRAFKGPIIGRSKREPGLAVMPFIINQDGDFKCWYQSLTSWEKIGDQYEPVYVIKYAFSDDGVDWYRSESQCVPSNYPLEAFSRPSVIFENGIYKMWYCYRDSADYRGGQGSYRIGYAESENVIDFVRKDNEYTIGLGSEGEFDSEMLAYPYVIDVDGRRLMFYNGSGFGQTGVGLAIWES